MEHLLYSKWAHKKRMALGIRLGESVPNDGAGIGAEGANHHAVPVMDGSNIKDFVELFRNKSHPVVLKNVASNWPLFEKWTPEFFAEQYPDDPVILFDAAVENSKLAYTEGKETKSINQRALYCRRRNLEIRGVMTRALWIQAQTTCRLQATQAKVEPGLLSIRHQTWFCRPFLRCELWIALGVGTWRQCRAIEVAH